MGNVHCQLSESQKNPEDAIKMQRLGKHVLEQHKKREDTNRKGRFFLIKWIKFD